MFTSMVPNLSKHLNGFRMLTSNRYHPEFSTEFCLGSYKTLFSFIVLDKTTLYPSLGLRMNDLFKGNVFCSSKCFGRRIQ